MSRCRATRWWRSRCANGGCSAAGDDDPPGSDRRQRPTDKPERQAGLWQRVGEYWWLAMNAGTPEAAWTGKHDATGNVFPAEPGWHYAWSAAFVSYVMRIAGAGPHFPYSASHADYIDIAKRDGARPDQPAGWSRPNGRTLMRRARAT